MKVKLEDSKIYLNGTEINFVKASRALTKTDFEEGFGIFEDDFSRVSFFRDGESVTVDFDSPFDIDDIPNFESEVRRRVRMVKEAFRKAKVIEFEIEV